MVLPRGFPRLSQPFGVFDVDDNGIELEVPSAATTLDLTNDTKRKLLWVGFDISLGDLKNEIIVPEDGFGTFYLKFLDVWSGLQGFNQVAFGRIALKASPGEIVTARWVFS